MKKYLKKIIRKIIFKTVPELKIVLHKDNNLFFSRNYLINSRISKLSIVHGKFSLIDVEVEDYTYVENNASISLTKIGKFCSIGPNFVCGYGIHPTNGISTAPMFYANNLSNGISFCNESKIVERKLITIGNDVWIGMNVTILDGVSIGNGAIIGAGAVVTKDVPDYAIYGGVPAKLIRYRFDKERIDSLLRIKWWNFEHQKLNDIERYFFDVDKFIEKYR